MIAHSPYQLKAETPKKGNGKGMVTPEQAVDILKKHGTIVTTEEAKVILTFLYKFGSLALNQVLAK